MNLNNILLILLILSKSSFCLADIPSYLPDKITSGDSVFDASGNWQEYGPKSLFDYINGGAELYIDAGFVRCYAREFKNQNSGTLLLNLYEMENSLQAFGLFQEMFGDDVKNQKVGSEAVTGIRRITFWKHNYFVEVIDKSEKELNSSIFHQAASNTAASLPGIAKLPEELSWFSDKSRVDGTEKYFHQNFKSRTFLNKVLSCDYKNQRIELTVFIVMEDSEAKALEVFGKLKLLGSPTDSKIITGLLNKLPLLKTDKCSAVLSGKYVIGIWEKAPDKLIDKWLKELSGKVK